MRATGKSRVILYNPTIIYFRLLLFSLNINDKLICWMNYHYKHPLVLVITVLLFHIIFVNSFGGIKRTELIQRIPNLILSASVTLQQWNNRHDILFKLYEKEKSC